MDRIVDLREYDVPYHVRFAIDNGEINSTHMPMYNKCLNILYVTFFTLKSYLSDIRSGLWYDVNVSSDGVTLERRHDLLQRAEVHVCAFDIETTKLPLKFPDAEYDLVMMISYMVDGQGYLIINREDLEYTPKPEFEGRFTVTNVKNEEELIKLWFSRMREVKPGIYVTYNGDFFDWPFLENRAAHHGLRTNDELGFQCDKIQGECCAKFACHLDCFAWVKRDSYLPQGSHGLKAVTKAKLGYDPLEVNPEDMVRFAIEKPQMMASYSVSDAVSTYYLYMTYVHPFIFSLATIIPMTPDEVLRKGSGTLCEMLLMVRAYKANVVCPNKHQAEPEKFYNNRLLESETYIGGHVECLETGVFRSDLPTSFKLDPSAFNQLIENLDRDLKYAINVEGKMELEDGSNYDEVKNAIMEKLIALRDEPTREEYPLIYHLDVAAMYPNIILTNRLQPPSVVTNEVCTACDFNRPGKTCLRNLEWEWRGETYTAKRSDYYHIKRQIESEFVDGLPPKPFVDLPKVDQQLKLKERLKKYCQKDMVVLYDSLQLAHKCILNSFYGYVMRKGARWYSMEMAGVVTYTGAKIIQNAHSLIKKIGRPLELDTDGIWCALPGSFPENFTFRYNFMTLVDPINRTYTEREECSIEFEVDGPYKAMILPASKEEGVLLKKRYAAELFEKFLHGSTLEECYSVVASVANRWLDLLDNQGKDIADSELLDYISESSTMSKSLADYGNQKSCAVTTAWRLADFLGDTMVKDKGLRCQYVVACEPRGNPVSERAVPVAIFETDAELMKFYLKKWCKISSDFDIRSIIDWSYYKQRLSSAIQKIITIPAAMQKVSNPVPRVVHPDWLYKKVREKEDKMTQRKLVDFFSSVNKINKDDPKNDAIGENHDPNEQNVADMEDFGSNGKSSGVGPRPIARSYETKRKSSGEGDSSKKKIDSDHSGNLPASSAQAIDVDIEDIDKHLDYQGWLDSKKRKWKQVREKKKRQRYFSTYKLVMRLNGLGTLDESNQRNGAIGIPSGVANTRRAQGTGVGSFFTRQELALIDSHWQIIQLVPSSQNGQFFAWVVVDGTMHKVLINVPRIITDEDQFRTESRKLAAHLADPEVEGIYETKVGLDFNFILQIGCVCKVDKSVKKRNAQAGWSLSELHMKTTTECSYLASSISFFYLYHSISDQRGIYLVYFPSRSTIHAVMVTPVQNKELSPHILEKQFREACHALSIKPPMPRDAFTFKVDYVGNAKDAQKVLQRAISEFRSQLHGPAIAVVECPNVASVKSGIRALDDFPCVNILSNARDSQYPALGWQIVAAKIGLRHCATSSRWLNEKISLSRYSHMLWVSDNGIPDLGGDNEEETCYFDEVNQPVLICDGAYRKVTDELKIHNLAVIALLVEFDEDLTLGSHELSELDEATPCVHAFRALRALIQRCVADATSSGNIFADELSQHVYRWLCSPRSKLHDPALLRMLHKAMNKVLALLLRKFRNSCSTIIFANYSKVILDTGKADLDAAQTYCGSLLETLQKRLALRILFEWIEPTQFWHSLLFMDQYHFTLIVSEFLYLPWKFAQDQASKRANVRDDDSCTPSITAAAAETFQSSVTEHLRKQIESYFTHKLLKIVSAIVLHVREKGKSHALELIKHVCAVLELDQNVQPEIQIMKKNLLKLVHVREFASEAQFQKCSIPFTLPNVICRDIDLRENSALLSQEWRCQCGQPYDREMMENSLLQIARHRERTYHLQDLVCLKCKQIKAAHLAEHCGCAGSFSLKESAIVFKDKMEVLLNIAVHQRFELLKECVSWILELS
ncbi:putative DNA-directed DNA polymerase [Helianthus annuus]|nr:putative DNA-directed DNA polymerase [Helianthus annuus]